MRRDHNREIELFDFPFEDNIDLLSAFVTEWSKGDGPIRSALQANLPEATGFHAETVKKGLAVAWDGFNGTDLWECVERELLKPLRTSSPRGFRRTTIVLAGSLPMPAWHGILLPLALRSRVYVKPSRHDPVSARMFLKALAQTSPIHAEAVEIAPNDDRKSLEKEIGQSECVVVYGTNETIELIRNQLPANKRLVSYGHRISCGVVGKIKAAQDLQEAATSLALDIALWDQLGCLSPVEVFVQNGTIDDLADELANQLESAENKWPKGQRDDLATVALAGAISDAEFRAAANPRTRTLVGSNYEWAVVRESDNRPRPNPLNRFIRLRPFDNLSDLANALAPMSRHLACIGISDSFAQNLEAIEVISSARPSRICRLGQMQSPPFSWHHDNQSILTPLSIATDVEI